MYRHEFVTRPILSRWPGFNAGPDSVPETVNLGAPP